MGIYQCVMNPAVDYIIYIHPKRFLTHFMGIYQCVMDPSVDIYIYIYIHIPICYIKCIIWFYKYIYISQRVSHPYTNVLWIQLLIFKKYIYICTSISQCVLLSVWYVYINICIYKSLLVILLVVYIYLFPNGLRIQSPWNIFQIPNTHSQDQHPHRR